MRGFRGSRAAQNQFGYHGSQSGRPQGRNYGGRPEDTRQGQAQSVAQNLPEWMKTPETRAREQQEARRPAVAAKPAAKAVPVAVVAAKPAAGQDGPRGTRQKASPVVAKAKPVARASKPAAKKAPARRKSA